MEEHIKVKWYMKTHVFIGGMVIGFFALALLVIGTSRPTPSSVSSSSSINQPPTASPPSATSSCDDANTLKQAQSVNYKELKKSPDTFSGRVTKFTGQVLEITESGDGGIMRLAVTKTSYGWDFADVIWVEYRGHTNAVDQDVVTVYGSLTGSKTYTSEAHYDITIPSLMGCLIEKGTAKTIEKTKLPRTIKQSNTHTPQSAPSSMPQQEATSPIYVPKSEPVPAPTAVPNFTSPTNAKLDTKTKILEGVDLTVNRPEDFVSDNPDSYYQPKVGNKYISIYISFDNESQNSFDYNPLNFKVVDPSGGSYDQGYGLANKFPRLSSGTLNPSNRVSGYVLFEVPATVPTAQFTVHYEGGYGYPHITVDFK